MAAVLVIALSGSTSSGATTAIAVGAGTQYQARESAASPRVAPVQTGAARASSSEIASRGATTLSEPSSCSSARKAVKFYAGRIAFWRSKMGAGERRSSARYASASCPRYLAHVLQRKARALRLQYARWLEHEWHWQAWLPAKFYRVARCETGVRWDWDSRQYDASGHYRGGYVSAFGIYWPAYEGYAHWDKINTPREQYEVAAAIQRRFGWSAWGCGGA